MNGKNDIFEFIMCIILPLRRIVAYGNFFWKIEFIIKYVVSIFVVIGYCIKFRENNAIFAVLRVHFLFVFISFFCRRWRNSYVYDSVFNIVFLRLVSLWIIFILSSGPFGFLIVHWFFDVASIFVLNANLYDAIPNFFEEFSLILFFLCYVGMWKISNGFLDSEMNSYRWRCERRL